MTLRGRDPKRGLTSADVGELDKELGQRDYIDLAGSWAITKQLTIRGGINNVFDKDPPIIGGSNLPGTAGNGNTFPQVYDALGRFIFGQLTMQF